MSWEIKKHNNRPGVKGSCVTLNGHKTTFLIFDLCHKFISTKINEKSFKGRVTDYSRNVEKDPHEYTFTKIPIYPLKYFASVHFSELFHEMFPH